MKPNTQELEQLFVIVCKHYRLTPSKARSRNRHQAYAFPRHVFHHIAYKLEVGSLSDIGAVTQRDHATVLHSFKRIQDWMTYDKELEKSITMIHNLFLNSNEVYAIQEKLKTIPVDKMPQFIKHINSFVC